MALLVFLPDKQIATILLRLRGIPFCEAIGLLAEPGMSGCNRPVHRPAHLRRCDEDVFLADDVEHAGFGELITLGLIHPTA